MSVLQPCETISSMIDLTGLISLMRLDAGGHLSRIFVSEVARGNMEETGDYAVKIIRQVAIP